MIKRWLLTALVALVSLLLVGCAGSARSSSRSSPAAGQVDAQVFNDVVEWAFPLPGATSQDRARGSTTSPTTCGTRRVVPNRRRWTTSRTREVTNILISI